MTEQNIHPTSRAPSAPARGELATLVAALRGISDIEPAELRQLQQLRNTPVQPVRLSYAIEDGEVALYARRALGGPGNEGVRCASVAIPGWMLDAEPGPAALDDQSRADLAELVRASFAVLEARIAEYFEFAAGSDTALALHPGPPPTLGVRPATTPSPRLQPALPSHEHGYHQSGDPRQAGGARQNRGTGGTGVDGTDAPAEAAVPSEQYDQEPLAGSPRAIEGTLGQALAEGSPTDEEPPAASPGRLGH